MKTLSKLTILLFGSIATVGFAKDYDCDNKYCKDMSSCDEAYYQLKVCGFGNLDRDDDGVPCEKICGKGGVRQSKQSKQTIANILKKREQGEPEEPQAEEKDNAQ